jgi:hypothetical protein
MSGEVLDRPYSPNRPLIIVGPLVLAAVGIGAAYWYWDDLGKIFHPTQGGQPFNPNVLRGTHNPLVPTAEPPKFSGSGFGESFAPFGFVDAALKDIRDYIITTYADVDEVVARTPTHDMVTRAGATCPVSSTYNDYRLAYFEFIKSREELTALVAAEAEYLKTHDLTKTEIRARVAALKSEIEARHQDLLDKAKAVERHGTNVVNKHHPLRWRNEYSQECT